jgi:membrane protease YdiL (CAAX protease family)
MKHESVALSLLGVLTVTTLVIGSLALIQRVDWPGRWLIGPSILMAGSLIPTLLTGGGSVELGLRPSRLWQTVRLTCVAGVVLGVLGLGGVLVLGHTGIELPLRASVPEGKWVQWILFQYLYAALPEELFFRGYLMSGIMRPLSSAMDKSVLRPEHAAVLLSAAAFALSHALILGNWAGLVTFFPGLAFAWLFARTGSLAGPVLLHGTANIAYGLITDIVT